MARAKHPCGTHAAYVRAVQSKREGTSHCGPCEQCLAARAVHLVEIRKYKRGESKRKNPVRGCGTWTAYVRAMGAMKAGLPNCGPCELCRQAQVNEYARLAARPLNVRQMESIARRCRTKGITVATYFEAHKAQNGLCANLSCGKVLTEGDRGTHIDHDHGTLAFRGLLCRGCNLMLGHSYDRPEALRGGALYLEAHGTRNNSAAPCVVPSEDSPLSTSQERKG